MSLPPLEKRRLRVSKGTLPSPYITNLASCHPFTKQLDVVFPTDSALLDALKGVQATCARGKISLLELYEKAEEFVDQQDVNAGSRLLVLSDDVVGDDCWCVDARAVLTMCVGKDTYERVGLVGRQLPFKGFEDRHVIEVALRKSAHTPAQQARFKEAFRVLDTLRRESLGRDTADWDVIYCALDHSAALDGVQLFREERVIKIAARCREMIDVHVPSGVLGDLRSDGSNMEVDQDDDDDDEDEADTRDRRVHAFFEWVGMACMGSQRLLANDSVDPYVALYDPPESSSVGSLTHVRWNGLLSPKLVEEVIHRISVSGSQNFVSVTSLAYTQSPVSYVTRSKASPGAMLPKGTLKLPRKDGEDTWSLVVEPDLRGDAQGGAGQRWCLVECIGQWDARWG